MTIVLGYSGLDGSAELLRECCDLDLAEQRIFQGMDAAAALVVGGALVAAAQEERFTGQKFDHRYPIESLRWCLEYAGVAEDDVDAIAHGFDFGPYERMYTSQDARSRYRTVLAPERQDSLLAQHLPALARRMRVRGVRHHEAHALSAAVASPFRECLTLVMDGMGEADAISVFRWSDGTIHRLATQDARSSLGILYSLITLHLGYQPNSDEYRVMALAAFGDPRRFEHLLQEAIVLRPGGRIEVPMLTMDRDGPYREQYRVGRQWLASRTFPPASEGAALGPEHADLAAAAQNRLEQAIVHVASHWIKETGLRDVAFAGGVALNCVANARLLRSGVARLFVQPAAGDEGTAIGAAYACSESGASDRFPALPLLGPDIESPSGARWTTLASMDASIDLAATLLEQGAIIGWATGQLEFGPRALGNRSILADPRSADVRDRVNRIVKFREPYRPFAPAVLSELADLWFDIPDGADARHMTVVVPVRAERRSTVPAITHVDGSARVQIVDRLEHPVFWRLLQAFHSRSGVPVLLNTSLNVKGQPIARSVDDALRTFEMSSLDALFVNNCVMARGRWRPMAQDGAPCPST